MVPSRLPSHSPHRVTWTDTLSLWAVWLLFHWFAIVLIAGAAICIAFPFYLIHKHPGSYTPLVDVLFSLFLTLLAFVMGGHWETSKAVRQANEKWLPTAESIIQRLLTLQSNVRLFSVRTESHCDETLGELPTLAEPHQAILRVKLRADCRASRERLDDIGDQLDDAISDWKRFIIAHCSGEECRRITEAIEQRERRIAEEIAKRKSQPPQCGDSAAGPSVPDATEQGLVGSPAAPQSREVAPPP